MTLTVLPVIRHDSSTMIVSIPSRTRGKQHDWMRSMAAFFLRRPREGNYFRGVAQNVARKIYIGTHPALHLFLSNQPRKNRERKLEILAKRLDDFERYLSKLGERIAAALAFILKLISYLCFTIQMFAAVMMMQIAQDENTNHDQFLLHFSVLFIKIACLNYIIVAFFSLRHEKSTVRLIWMFAVESLCTITILIVGFAEVFTVTGIVSPADAGQSKLDYGFSNCLYFSIITWTTVGYGDFTPSLTARMYAATEALCGYVSMGIFMSGIVYLVTVSAKSTKNS